MSLIRNLRLEAATTTDEFRKFASQQNPPLMCGVEVSFAQNLHTEQCLKLAGQVIENQPSTVSHSTLQFDIPLSTLERPLRLRKLCALHALVTGFNNHTLLDTESCNDLAKAITDFAIDEYSKRGCPCLVFARVEVNNTATFDNVDLGNCAICLEELVEVDWLIKTPCSHVFHGLCISHWLPQKNSCPICRCEFLSF